MTRFSLGITLLVGAAIRLALIIINVEVTTLPQGGADAIHFERAAWELSELGRGDITQYLMSGTGAITLLGSFVYDFTGRSPYVLGLAMLVLGLGVIYFVYQAVLELWDDKRMARAAAWFAALFPQLTLHSVLFLRETPVSFCLAAAALCAIRFVKRNNIAYAIWFSVWVLVGTLFHSGVIVAIPAFILGILLVRPRTNRGAIKRYTVNVGAAAVLLVAIYTMNSTGYGLNKFGGSLDSAVEQFEQKELRRTVGDAAFPDWMRIRGGMSDVWKIPIRIVAFLFAPMLPLMVRSPQHLLGVVDAALYLILFWTVWRNWDNVKDNRAAVVLLVILMALCIVYALGVANFGTAIRHRAKMSPILLLIAAGLPYLQQARRRTSRSMAVASKLSAFVRA